MHGRGGIGAVGNEKRGYDFVKILAGKDGAYICFLYFMVFVAVQGLSFAFFWFVNRMHA